jgi:hypothetical protein
MWKGGAKSAIGEQHRRSGAAPLLIQGQQCAGRATREWAIFGQAIRINWPLYACQANSSSGSRSGAKPTSVIVIVPVLVIITIIVIVISGGGGGQDACTAT